MGAVPAAQGAPAGEPPLPGVCAAACLSEAQRLALAAELGCGEDEAQGGGRESRSDGAWEVYYDRIDFALTLRGWWLRECGGQWLLQAPAAEGGGYEEITVIEDILERVGLAPYAEAWKKWNEKQRNLEKLLHQASVVPFARLRVHRRTLSVPLPITGAQGGTEATEAANLAGSSAELVVGLETLHLDVKFAEDEAVSKLLFTLGGIAARKKLQVSMVDLSVTGANLAEKAVASSAYAMLGESLRARGLDVTTGPCPKAMAYVRSLRPTHHRALIRHSAVPSAAGQAADVEMVH